MACWSLPVYPDFARTCLDAVTCLVSLPALCLHHPDSIPASDFSVEEHLCCSQISGTLLLSLPPWCCTALVPPSSPREFRHSPAAPPVPLGQERWEHSWGSSTWPFLCPFPSPQLFLSPSCVTVSLVSHQVVPPKNQFSIIPHPGFMKQMSHGFLFTARGCIAGGSAFAGILGRAEKCSLKLDQIPLHELIPGSNLLPWG